MEHLNQQETSIAVNASKGRLKIEKQLFS